MTTSEVRWYRRRRLREVPARSQVPWRLVRQVVVTPTNKERDMPTNRKLLGAAAFSLALAGGGAAGALLGTPNLSSAQDGTEDTTETTVDDAGRGRFEHRGEGLAAAAEAIGITED